MKTFLFLFSLLTVSLSFGQDELSFSEVGSEPAYCRLFDYQNGNGLVYAGAVGGIPDYNYLWTDLQTGETTTNSTWGGRNPGDYEIMVTDDAGNVAKDTVRVDSLNPFADFVITGPGIMPVEWGFVGEAPVEVTITNTSSNFANPNSPLSDTVFFLQTNFPDGEWELFDDFPELRNETYATGGTYQINLIAMNENGCSDSTILTLGLFEPLDVEESTPSDEIRVTSTPQSNTVVINKTSDDDQLVLTVYDLSGKELFQRAVTNQTTEFQSDRFHGVVIYDLTNPQTNMPVLRGKLFFN